MFNNELRTVTVDVEILEYYIGNVYTCRNTKYCDLEAYMELLMYAKERGRVCESTKSLADRWKWSQGKVRRFLDFLERAEMIRTEKAYTRGKFYIYVFEPEESNE